jgi:hypothetical protein
MSKAQTGNAQSNRLFGAVETAARTRINPRDSDAIPYHPIFLKNAQLCIDHTSTRGGSGQRERLDRALVKLQQLFRYQKSEPDYLTLFNANQIDLTFGRSSQRPSDKQNRWKSNLPHADGLWWAILIAIWLGFLWRRHTTRMLAHSAPTSCRSGFSA